MEATGEGEPVACDLESRRVRVPCVMGLEEQRQMEDRLCDTRCALSRTCYAAQRTGVVAGWGVEAAATGEDWPVVPPG